MRASAAMIRRLPTWLMAVAVLGAAARGGVESEWKVAAAAYDGRRYEEAAAIWERALQDGADDPALWYNLGNARFKLGRIGEAVAAYRRAWRLAPRDSQILSNVRLALDAGGASPPARRWYEDMLERLSADEARILALGGWWALWLLLAAARVARSAAAAPWLRRGALAAAFVCALGAAALAHGRRLDAEHIVTATGRSAQFAPLEEARAYFTLPPGSIVSVIEQRGEWRRIRLDDREGWVRADALLALRDAASPAGGALRVRPSSSPVVPPAAGPTS